MDTLGVWLNAAIIIILGALICILPWRFAVSENKEERFWILVILYCISVVIQCYFVWFVNRWNIIGEEYRLPATIALVAVPNALGLIAVICYHLGGNGPDK